MGCFANRKKSRGALGFTWLENCWDWVLKFKEVGNDLSGTEIVQELEKNHISNSLGTVEYPTGSVMVELKEGIPTYTIIEGVAWDHIPLTQESIDLIKRADAICFGTLALRSQASKETILSLLSYAREDALRFFDINIRQSYYSKELIETLLHKANVFKINDEELVLLRDMCKLEGSDDEVCRQILQMYNLKYLVLTAGCASICVSWKALMMRFVARYFRCII